MDRIVAARDQYSKTIDDAYNDGLKVAFDVFRRVYFKYPITELIKMGFTFKEKPGHMNKEKSIGEVFDDLFSGYTAKEIVDKVLEYENSTK